MDLIDLLTPVAAVLALFAAVWLAVLYLRQARVIRDLEERVRSGGGAAAPASLDRIAQLQARMDTSTGLPVAGPVRRVGGVVASALVLLAAVGAGGWYLLRDTGTSAPKKRATTNSAEPDRGPTPVGDGSVPNEPAPLPNAKSAYTVSVLNASSVNGAARSMLQRVGQLGYAQGTTGNASPIATTIVQFSSGNRLVGQHVAADLKATLSLSEAPKAKRLDGISANAVGGADAVIILGSDLASSVVSGSTPSTSSTPSTGTSP